MKFKIGDRVRCIESQDGNSYLIGKVGVFKGRERYNKKMLAIEFEERNDRMHNCRGILDNRNGWFMSESKLELVDDKVDDKIYNLIKDKFKGRQVTVVKNGFIVKIIAKSNLRTICSYNDKLKTFKFIDENAETKTHKKYIKLMQEVKEDIKNIKCEGEI